MLENVTENNNRNSVRNFIPKVQNHRKTSEKSKKNLDGKCWNRRYARLRHKGTLHFLNIQWDLPPNIFWGSIFWNPLAFLFPLWSGRCPSNICSDEKSNGWFCIPLRRQFHDHFRIFLRATISYLPEVPCGQTVASVLLVKSIVWSSTHDFFGIYRASNIACLTEFKAGPTFHSGLIIAFNQFLVTSIIYSDIFIVNPETFKKKHLYLMRLKWEIYAIYHFYEQNKGKFRKKTQKIKVGGWKS